MPTLKYLPEGTEIEVPENAKVLAVAIKNKIDIRYGCGACRCGTCCVAIEGEVSEMKPNERALLEQMHLPLDGSVRLACQTRVISGTVTVDLDFQNQYSPDSGLD